MMGESTLLFKSPVKIISVAVRVSSFFILILAISACTSDDNKRWYSQQQAQAGQQIYQDNCATCHGKSGQSTIHWRKPGADGRYPAPPLNGSAHTWHHSKAALLRQIRDGSIANGGSMPAFKHSLSEAQQLQVLAAVQAFWSDEIYNHWLKIDANSL